MVGSQQMTKAGSYCTLCPGGCELRLAAAGPDSWCSEYAPGEGTGVCPRGSTLAELVGHGLRLRTATRRQDGSRREVDVKTAVGNILQAAAGKELTFLLDANLPCEQLAAAAAWCDAWDQASLCLVMEPADEQLLLGTEASGAEYLSDEALAACDGFLIIGDAFAANPACSRQVFDRRAAEPRMPIVVMDAAAGTASKFASHRVEVAPGGEVAALAALAAAAGAKLDTPGAAAGAPPSAAAAGKALAGCQRLGVLLSAEYGRSSAWRQIGYLAGQLASALGGGLACQTTGANVLAALRLGGQWQTLSLAEALQREPMSWIAVGCDVLGMLGWPGRDLLAAAAALPNATTEAAEFVLPTALPAELAGTCLICGEQPVETEPLLAPPAGVPTPAEIIEQLARQADVSPPAIPSEAPPAPRLSADAPAPAGSAADPPSPRLLFGRQALHAGCGSVTGHGSWQRSGGGVVEVRISPQDAAEAGAKPLGEVQVRSGDGSLAARVRICQELPAGTVVLPEGWRETRALAPLKIDADGGAVVGEPADVTIEA